MRGAEVPHGSTPYPIVLRWIGRDHAGLTIIRRSRRSGFRRYRRLGALSKIRADPGVMQYRDDLPVCANDVAAVWLPRHRRLPELGVERIWIGTVGVQKGLLP